MIVLFQQFPIFIPFQHLHLLIAFNMSVRLI